MREHWEDVYRTRGSQLVSWYTPTLDISLRLIQQVAPPPARIIDVGGGASTLVDDLLARSYTQLTVLDIADGALRMAWQRLGPRAAVVQWLRADVTTADLAHASYDLWHDRAVFHFMTTAAQRSAYLARLRHALSPRGFVIMATFAPDGPTRCSGLDIVRYDAEHLSAELGSSFVSRTTERAVHTTPQGRPQAFHIQLFQRVE